MNKLQLYITKSYNGYKSLVNFNPSEDVSSHVRDLVEAVKLVDYNPAEKTIFYVLRYINEGSLFTIIRTIPSRPNDHLAATIYVPNGLGIPAKDLEEIIKFTERKVGLPGVKDKDLAELREIFSREYPLDREAPSIVASYGDKYAYANYGTDALQLKDLYEKGLFQPPYAQYKGVILVPEFLNLAVEGDDLSDVVPADMVTILPPEEPGEFTPYIYGKPLNRPFRVALNSLVRLTWKRQNFEDMHQEVTITHSGFVPEEVNTADSRKVITPGSFHITSQFSKEPISNPNITVNGVQITAEGHAFTQADLRKASVTVSADGYESYSATIDMASSARALIQLHERGKIYNFEIPVKSSDYGSPIKFYIKTNRKIEGSPIDGYALLDSPIKEGQSRINHLGFMYGSRNQSLVVKGIYAGIGLVVGIVLMLLCGTCSGNESKKDADSVQTEAAVTDNQSLVTTTNVSAPVAPQPAPQQQAAQQQAAPTENVSGASISYLDNNQKWTRDDLEKNGLAGLYDDLNSFRYDRITSYWAPKLSKSSAFKKVADAAEKGKKKKRKDNRSTYSDTNSFSWRSWTYHVDP